MKTVATLSVLFLSSPVAAAQESAPARFAPLGGFDRSAVEPFLFFDEPGDGAIWVRGETYKAKFDAGGATFIPFLGSHAPRNFPVRFALESVSRGGVPLPVAELAAPRREGNRIAFDRGGVEERYECRPEGIEQVFVVDGVPGAGDLVVRMEVETDLAYAGIADGSLTFSAEGLGEVRYGGAVAFDEGGASVGATRSWDASGIELRVPAAFVAAASGPITIDPLISVFCVFCNPSADQSGGKASYDATTDRFLAVFGEPFSATDWDVASLELDSTGAFVPGSLVYIDSTAASWVQPAVANNNASNRHLVVATSNLHVWGRLRNAGSTAMLPQFQISTPPSSGSSSADVGGDPSTSGSTTFCVVWTRIAGTGPATTVEYRRVDPNGGMSAQALLGQGEFSAISRSNGSDRWTAGWRQGFDLWAAQIGSNGTIVTPTFPIGTTPSLTYGAPTLSSPDVAGRVLVAWESSPSASVPLTIVGRVYDGATALTPETDLVALAGGGITGSHRTSPTVDSDGCGFSFVFRESPVGSVGLPDLYPATLHYSPAGRIGLTEQTQTSLAGGPWEEGPAQIVSKWSGGGTGPRHLMIWESETLAAGSDISGAIFDSLPSPCVPGGSACPLFSADFEGTGLAPYSEGSGPLPVPTLWHGESFCDAGVPIPASMGTKAAAYNLGDVGTYNYNTGGANSGSLQSPFITASAGTASASLFLTFDYMRETEGGATFDQSFVEVRPAGGAWVLASQIVDQQPCGTPAHVSVAVPLAGGNWQHRFRFSTGDAVANGFRGWYVDNVKAYQSAASCGSFTGDPTGCGGPILTASGAPLLGGTVNYTLSGTTGVPVMWIGNPTSVPLCPPSPCTLGATLGILFQTTSLSGTIPVQPSLIGAVFSIQGGDALGGGGCGAGTFGIPFAVSQTIQTTIG